MTSWLGRMEYVIHTPTYGQSKPPANCSHENSESAQTFVNEEKGTRDRDTWVIP